MKLGFLLLVCLSALAQGWGRREAMRPWLQGDFSEAERQFALMRRTVPTGPDMLAWEAEFEIERARFGLAAACINQAKRMGMTGTAELLERRQARLLLSVGQFAEAYQVALEGHRWDGKDVRKLKVSSAMDLLTLGEVALARGDFSKAIAVLERARDRAKNTSSLFGLEWLRAQNGIAIANINLGSIRVASQVAHLALSAAEREWGASSVPAMDVLDTIGLIQLSESDYRNAGISLARSREWREASYGTSHPKVAESYTHAALLSAAQGENAIALRLVARALAIEKALAVGPNGRWAMALLSGTEVFTKAGEADEARACYESAIPVLERELGSDAPRLESARKRASELTGK